MKAYRLSAALLAAGLALAGLPASADVRELGDGRLQAVEFQGKPPFKRRTVDASEQPAEFARFEELRDNQPRPLFASERRGGAPGKNLPRQAQRVSSDAGEIAEFARFEESAEPASESKRLWRGAPGKGRPVLQD